MVILKCEKNFTYVQLHKNPYIYFVSTEIEQ